MRAHVSHLSPFEAKGSTSLPFRSGPEVQCIWEPDSARSGKRKKNRSGFVETIHGGDGKVENEIQE